MTMCINQNMFFLHQYSFLIDWFGCMHMPKPIQGAKVEIFKDGELVASGLTDENGRFVTTLPIGTYHVKVSKAGYKTHEQDVILYADYTKVVYLEKPMVPPNVVDPSIYGFGAEDLVISFGSPDECAEYDIPRDQCVDGQHWCFGIHTV